MIGIEEYLVIISILMQLFVFVVAAHRAFKSSDKLAVTWSMLALVFGLMAFRRSVSFGLLVGINIPFVFPEIIAFVISLLLCISVYNISKTLPALEDVVSKRVPETSKKLKDIANELAMEMKTDIENIDEYRNNAESLRRSRQSLMEASTKLVNIAHNLESLTNGVSRNTTDDNTQ